MKKEAEKKEHVSHLSTNDNSFGVASVILGILSILFASPPLYGIIIGIIAFVFASKQKKVSPNKWSKAGKILAIIGIVLSILFFILLAWLAKNPEILQQLPQPYAT